MPRSRSSSTPAPPAAGPPPPDRMARLATLRVLLLLAIATRTAPPTTAARPAAALGAALSRLRPSAAGTATAPGGDLALGLTPELVRKLQEELRLL